MKLSKTISFSDIPHSWIFKNYLNINHSFDGSSIKIKSVWNPTEKVPSMIIYYDKDRYRFKDFSSGNSGDGIDLIMALKTVNFLSAVEIITKDFNRYLEDGNTNFINSDVSKFEYKISKVEYRDWNQDDVTFWNDYNISLNILNKYNVKPLSYYVMDYLKNGIVIKSYTFRNTHLYGYHSIKKGLYKIYIPLNKDQKFIMIQSYINGVDQLRFTKPNLIMLSSLKDLMSFDSLGFKTFEYIAAESEGVLIPKNVDKIFSNKYERKFILFDNDGPGNKYADMYKEQFLYRKITLEMEKDLSDSIKHHGVKSVKERLYLTIKNLL